MPLTDNEIFSEPYAGGTLHTMKPVATVLSTGERTAFWFAPSKEGTKWLNRLEIHETCSIPCTVSLYDEQPMLRLSQEHFVHGTESRCLAGVRHVKDDGSRWNWTGWVDCGLIMAAPQSEHIKDFKGSKTILSELDSAFAGISVGRFELQIPGYRPNDAQSPPFIKRYERVKESWTPDDYLASPIHPLTFDDERFWPESLRVSLLPAYLGETHQPGSIPTMRASGDCFARSVLLQGFHEASWDASDSTLVDRADPNVPKAFPRKLKITNMSWPFQLAWRIPGEIQFRLDMSSATSE